MTLPSRQAVLPGPEEEGSVPGPTGRLSIQQRSHTVGGMSSVRETGRRASISIRNTLASASLICRWVVAQEKPVQSPLPLPPKTCPSQPGCSLLRETSLGEPSGGHSPVAPPPCPHLVPRRLRLAWGKASLHGLGSPSWHLVSLTEEPQAVTRVGAPKKLVQDGDLLREVDPVISWRCLRTNSASWDQGRLLGGRGI